jgi:type I restriction-modification system DNA methylase subunit
MLVIDIVKKNNVFVKEMNERFDIILDYVNSRIYNTTVRSVLNENANKQIISLLEFISIDENELFQILFMFYCNKKTKIDLDQFYTPYTIGNFITQLMIPNRSVIDPACGTGDLVKNYDGSITLWDISPEVSGICEQNYIFNLYFSKFKQPL